MPLKGRYSRVSYAAEGLARSWLECPLYWGVLYAFLGGVLLYMEHTGYWGVLYTFLGGCVGLHGPRTGCHQMSVF
jgi:hypothetical protein